MSNFLLLALIIAFFFLFTYLIPVRLWLAALASNASVSPRVAVESAAARRPRARRPRVAESRS